MTLLTSIRRLILEYRASERIHNVHPSNVYDMTKNFSYKESRIIITKSGKLYIADAGKYTHMMMEKELKLNADQNWAIAGHLNIKEGWFYLTEFPGVRNNPIAKELSRILLSKGLRQPTESELFNERPVNEGVLLEYESSEKRIHKGSPQKMFDYIKNSRSKMVRWVVDRNGKLYWGDGTFFVHRMLLPTKEQWFKGWIDMNQGPNTPISAEMTYSIAAGMNKEYDAIENIDPKNADHPVIDKIDALAKQHKLRLDRNRLI